jgi:formylglycine-generating enzyme required for sulfatase activity
VFEKVLCSFETGGFTYPYALAELKRLLAAGASPTELLEVLRRRQLIEPLPQDAYLEIFNLLDTAEARVAEEKATSAQAKSVDADTPPDKVSEPVSTPAEPTALAPRIWRHENPVKQTSDPLTSVFARVLSVFEASGFTNTDVLAQLKRLLIATGASPKALLAILQRRQLIEPLPEHAHMKLLWLLNEVIGSVEARNQEPDIAVQTHGPVHSVPSRISPPTQILPAARIAMTPTAPADPRNRSAAEERVATVTPIPAVPTDSVAARADTPPPPTGLMKDRTPPPPAEPDSVSSNQEITRPIATQTITSRPVPPAPTSSRAPAEERAAAVTPTPPVPPDSVAARVAAAPPDLIKALNPSPPVEPAVEKPAAVIPARIVPPVTAQITTTSPSPSVRSESGQVSPTQTITSRPVPPAPTLTRAPVEERVAAVTPTPPVPPVTTQITTTAPSPAATSVSAKKETGLSIPMPTLTTGSVPPAPTSGAPVETESASAKEAVQPVRVQVPALNPVPSPASRPHTATQSTISTATSVPASTVVSAGKQAAAVPGATQSTISSAHSGPTSTGRTIVGQTPEVNASRIPLAESDTATPEAPAPAAAQLIFPSTPSERRRAAVTAARRVLQDWLSGKTRTTTRDSLKTTRPPPPVAATMPEEEVTIDFDEVDRSKVVAQPEVLVPAQSPLRETRTRPLVLKRGKPWKRSSFALTLGGGAAVVLAIAATVWFSGRHAPPVPAPAQTPTLAALPNPGTVIRDCPMCPGMTVLPTGRFQQGSESSSASFEKPLHWVMINRPLAMSTNAVTVDEFKHFIKATGRDMQGCDTYDGAWKRHPKNSWKNPGFSQTGAHPVTCTSWNDAVAYAQWLSTTTGHSYRLPSASEWEYAARAAGLAVLPWSADGSGACENANVADESAAHKFPGWSVFGCKDGYVYTAPVGSFKSNAFGLNDMLGNVFQWTKDCWSENYVGAPIDGSARTDGNCAEHELRGGSWFSTPAFVRANYRNHFAADYRTSSVGIRLVRDIER